MKKKEKPLRNLGKELKSVNDRIEFVRRTLEYPISSFARKVGGSKSAMINVLSATKNDDPSFKLLKNITTVFPVSDKWLLVGDGEPFTVDDLEPWKYAERVDELALDVEVNARIKMIRMESELSQALFADSIEATRDIVSFLENNRTAATIPLVKRISKKYNVNLYWLLFGEGNVHRK